jgi:2,4-dienoyl-CoA reductase-like NADH-dependent reductase (Old Yellow Enzyme family)
MAEKDGKCGVKLTKLMEKLARGEVGLIITGFAYVMPNGQAMPGQLGIHSNAMTPNLHEMTKAVHKAKGKICTQIVHAGVQTLVKDRGNLPVWGPSAVPDKVFGWTPKAMSQKEIKETVQAFASAAARAKRAGFDAIQLHGAHGYLLSQFLSPAKNKRTDKYGGPIENRARFLFEVYRAVRRSVGRDFPVLIKLNSKDFLRGGFNERDSLFVAKKLDEMGIDAIEMSGGTPASGNLGPARMKIRTASDEAYFRSFAKKIKKQVSCPIILVGGNRSPQAIGQILETGDADLVSMSRPFIREPGLIKRWRQGDTKKAKCISCNQCFGAAIQAAAKRGSVYCAVERRLKKKKKK